MLSTKVLYSERPLRSPPGFYVYVLIDPFTGSPFYIGKGKQFRAWAHERDAKHGRTKRPVTKKITSMGSNPIIGIVDSELKESEAYDLEELSISVIGRRTEGGPLLNLSEGGRGGCAGFSVKLTPEQNQKKLSALKSPEVRKKISDGVKRSDRKLTPEGAAILSKTHSGKVLSIETRNKISSSKKGQAGHPHTEESKAKIAEYNRRRFVSEETKRKISESVKNRPLTSQQRKRQREKTQIQVKCPHCDKIGSRSIMMRWHFDNCKFMTPKR